jgi:hypothetical protein
MYWLAELKRPAAAEGGGGGGGVKASSAGRWLMWPISLRARTAVTHTKSLRMQVGFE